MPEDQQQQDQQGEQKADEKQLAPEGERALERIKAELKEAKAKAKANEDAAKRLADIEEANQTEQQKIAARAEKAERELAAERLNGWRTSVALEKGLTASQAKRLVGNTRDELTADADELLADIGAAKEKQDRRSPSFDQGSRTNDKPSAKEQADAQLARRFPQAAAK